MPVKTTAQKRPLLGRLSLTGAAGLTVMPVAMSLPAAAALVHTLGVDLNTAMVGKDVGNHGGVLPPPATCANAVTGGPAQATG